MKRLLEMQLSAGFGLVPKLQACRRPDQTVTASAARSQAGRRGRTLWVSSEVGECVSDLQLVNNSARAFPARRCVKKSSTPAVYRRRGSRLDEPASFGLLLFCARRPVAQGLHSSAQAHILTLERVELTATHL